MNPGTVVIHLIRPEPCAADPAAADLPPEDLRRAASFRFPEDASVWVSYRIALRRILADLIGVPPRDVPLEQGPAGKPLLPPPFAGIHFNLSHCRSLALLAVGADGPLGIDVEPLDRAPGLCGCETSFCHPAEIADLPADASRGLRLLEIWTAKEALLKALGTGLSTAPETVRILGNGESMTATAEISPHAVEDFVIRRLQHPALRQHLAALASSSAVTRIEVVASPGSTSARDSATNLRQVRPNHG